MLIFVDGCFAQHFTMFGGIDMIKYGKHPKTKKEVTHKFLK
jgi:hypothetical protein